LGLFKGILSQKKKKKKKKMKGGTMSGRGGPCQGLKEATVRSFRPELCKKDWWKKGKRNPVMEL